MAAEQASFIQAFSKIGLIPDSGGIFTLPRLIGWQGASAIMMLGDKISALEAVQIGMIYKMFSTESFADEVSKLAETLSIIPTQGLALTQKALNESHTNDLRTPLDVEHR
jgi:2-(1,2-epoxy-1,2-dihydrophenyl)acetyl-CoA isomerase